MAVGGNNGGAGGAKNLARAQRPRKPKPVPKPSPVKAARSQERAYASQGKAVEKVATQQKQQAQIKKLAKALPKSRTAENHKRAENVRKVRTQIPAAPVRQPGLPPEVKTPPSSTLPAPKQRPLSALDVLNTKGPKPKFTPNTAQIHRQQQNTAEAGIKNLFTTGRSLHKQEKTIERLRQVGVAPGTSKFQKMASEFESKQNATEAGARDIANLKGKTAKEYAKKHPELFTANEATLKKMGFSADVGAEISKNAAKDIASIGETPVSIYHQAAPIVAATAKGDLKKAGKETVKAAEANAQIYVDLAKHPVRTLKEHPILAPAALLGPKAVVGRGSGFALRKGALGSIGKRAAATGEKTEFVPGTSLRTHTKPEYSKDVITKAGQVAVKKVKAARATRKETLGQPVKPKAIPGRMSEREVARRIDERIAANEDIRRVQRSNVIHEAHKALKDAPEHITSLVAQGITKADRADVEAYIRELEAHHAKLSPADKALNQSLRKNLQKELDANPDMGKVEQAAAAYSKIIDERQPALVEHGILGNEQAIRAKMIPYAVRKMGAYFDKGLGAIAVEGKNGPRVLKTDEMLLHYKEHNGGRLPTYVTQRRGSLRGSYNVRSERAPSLGPGHRSGESTRGGLFDTSHEALQANAARVQGIHDAVEGFNGIVKEFSVKHDGKVAQFKTRKEAVEAGRNMRFDENGNFLAQTHEMVPIRLRPFKGGEAQLEDLINRTHGDELYGKNSPVRDAIESALRGDEGEGPWTLIPKAAADRLAEHMGTMGSTTFEQAFSAGTNLFRGAVLSTSPTWIVGNAGEAALRTALLRAGPSSYLRGRRVLATLKKENPQLHQEIMARVVGGGHMSTAHRMQVVRTAEQFTDTKIEPLANALHAVREHPGPKQVADAWKLWTDHVFHYNSKMESAFQTAMLGRLLKKNGMKAIDDAVRGLHNTEAQVEFGRMVDEAYGKYSKWSPSTRVAIANYTPFISWWLNAAKFVAYTLPKDHPIATSVAATSLIATKEWREKQKIDLWSLAGSSGEFIAGTVPLPGGRHVNIGRYTPFGAISNPSSIPDIVLPQTAAFKVLLTGKNWKDQPVKNRLAGFGEELAGAYIPFFQRAQAAKKYGVKQSLNPFRPIAPGKKKGHKKKGHSPSFDILSGPAGSHSIEILP